MYQSDKSNKREKTYSVSSIFYINKGDRTSHWVVCSLLKELYINDFFEGKQTIKDMESELTEAPKNTSNTDNLEVAEEANVDEAISEEYKASNNMEIDLKEERKTQARSIHLEKHQTFEIILLYFFVYGPLLSCIYFVSLFKCEKRSSISIFIVFLYAFVLLYF